MMMGSQSKNRKKGSEFGLGHESGQSAPRFAETVRKGGRLHLSLPSCLTDTASLPKAAHVTTALKTHSYELFALGLAHGMPSVDAWQYTFGRRGGKALGRPSSKTKKLSHFDLFSVFSPTGGATETLAILTASDPSLQRIWVPYGHIDGMPAGYGGGEIGELLRGNHRQIKLCKFAELNPITQRQGHSANLHSRQLPVSRREMLSILIANSEKLRQMMSFSRGSFREFLGKVRQKYSRGLRGGKGFGRASPEKVRQKMSANLQIIRGLIGYPNDFAVRSAFYAWNCGQIRKDLRSNAV